ncbi:MAG: hypothetical protein NT091_05345 [Candidatus Falkowbacteria bacterium]|nr:hypothetical protein [Candidatus Falkowbacteria bacterium]
MMTKINLEQLGFSKKEASVYLASLELGASSVQKIAEQAQVNRVTTYVIIEGIKSKVIYTSSEGEIKNASSTKEV